MTGSKLGIVILLAFPVGFRPGLPHPTDAATSAPAAETKAAAPGDASAATPSDAFASTPSDAFASTVRPVLAAKCAPCHEPGGKMYGSLPFDKGETIASHREGVLKRLKGDDRAAVEKWLAALPPPPAPSK